MSLSDPAGVLGDLVSAKIVSAEPVEGQGFTLYAIQVTNRADGSVWTVYRRFSNFIALQSHLPKGVIPTESSLHGGVLASSTAPEIVERRRELLEDFLGTLLAQPTDQILNIRQVVDFLRLPFSDSPCTPSEVDQSWLSNTSIPPVQETTDFKTLTSSVNKMKEENLNAFLLDLMQRISCTSLPSASNVYALATLQHLVCVETNVDSACVLHALVHIPGWQSMLGLSNFLRAPTSAGSRLMAFKVIKALLEHLHSASAFSILQGDDQAMAQYTAWSTRQPIFDLGASSAPATVSLGPQSPLARSVYAHSAPAGGHALATAALEAREWVSFAASSSGCDNRFRLAGSISHSAADWVVVPIPKESIKKLIGKLELRYRVQSTGLGASSQVYELRIDWQLPSVVEDMDRILSLLWEGSYFGFLAEPARTIPVPSEAANCTETVECVIKDQRTIGGTVAVSLVKSCMRSFNGRVVMASTTDPLASGGLGPSNSRRIKHLHFLGCEVDAERRIVTGCALLSSESIFLVAGDLLGERLMLWQALEQLSLALTEAAAAPDVRMAEWLRMSSVLIG